MLHQLEEVFFPETLAQALEKLNQYEGAAAPIAGGTDIVADPPPGIRCLVNITHLGLDYVQEDETHIRIGATTTMQRLATSPEVAALAGGILSLSTCEGWPRPIRNAATIGGNLAGAGPFADTPPAMLALGAEAVVVTSQGEKTVAMDDFFLDYRTTAVSRRGILKEVRIPRVAKSTRGIFLKLSRTQVDQALVNVGATIELEDGCCRRARIAVGAVSRVPCRLTEAERKLEGRRLDAETIEEIKKVVSDTVEPMVDFRASADYRREMSAVLVGRALMALGRGA
ncbi:hypothetical protein DYH09_03240 [bacterium CPR1]|nr:hypothetical protein [bacterium CPR1]